MTAEEQKQETPKEEAKKPETPKEEKKPEVPEEKKEEVPKEEKKPEVPEEKKEEVPKEEKKPEVKTASKPKKAAAKKESKDSTFKKPETVEQAVALYNEMVLTAIDLGITKIAPVKTFVDLKTGVVACQRLHDSVERARDPKSTSATKTKEKDMAKKAAKKASAPKKTGSGRAKLTDDTKITWTGKKNPFREKDGPWTRTERVRENSGLTVKALRAKKVKTGTIRTLLKMELVKAS